MTENTYVFTDDGSPLFTKKYTLQVDENTETNVGWSVASFLLYQIMKFAIA